MTRDNNWLQGLLDEIWDTYFPEVPQHNIVRIEFGRRAKNRLGSIKLDAKDRQVSIITINGLFRKASIPESIVRATIVHELSHYAHGFNSPLAQKFRHPHAGGVMRSEFEERGLGALYKEQRKWLKDNWRQIVQDEFGTIIRRRRINNTNQPNVPKPFWFKR